MRRRVFLIGLGLAALVSGALAGEEEWTRREPAPTPEVMVYYFHRHIRCMTCRDMESMAAETVDLDFAAEVASGLLAWQTIDVEDEGQEHFATEFAITGPTLILAELDDAGRTVNWRNLERTWELAEDPIRYNAYVREGIRSFLAGEGTGAKGSP